MDIDKDQLLKIHDTHKGWIEYLGSNNKTHYFITDQEDFYISACGKVIPDRDLATRFDDNYKFKGSLDNRCKRCISAYKKIKNGDLKGIKVQGIII